MNELTMPNRYVLDRLESEIGYKSESRKYDGELLSEHWAEVISVYGRDVFKAEILNLFEDFTVESEEAVTLIIELINRGTEFNRVNLARLFGILRGSGTVTAALSLIEKGISFDAENANELFIAFPDDIYGYLKNLIPADEAIRIALKATDGNLAYDLWDMEYLQENHVPIGYIRRLWQLDVLRPAVECYAHARDFLRICWYFQNYTKDFSRMFAPA